MGRLRANWGIWGRWRRPRSTALNASVESGFEQGDHLANLLAVGLKLLRPAQRLDRIAAPVETDLALSESPQRTDVIGIIFEHAAAVGRARIETPPDEFG